MLRGAAVHSSSFQATISERMNSLAKLNEIPIPIPILELIIGYSTDFGSFRRELECVLQNSDDSQLQAFIDTPIVRNFFIYPALARMLLQQKLVTLTPESCYFLIRTINGNEDQHDKYFVQGFYQRLLERYCLHLSEHLVLLNSETTDQPSSLVTLAREFISKDEIKLLKELFILAFQAHNPSQYSTPKYNDPIFKIICLNRLLNDVRTYILISIIHESPIVSQLLDKLDLSIFKKQQSPNFKCPDQLESKSEISLEEPRQEIRRISSIFLDRLLEQNHISDSISNFNEVVLEFKPYLDEEKSLDQMEMKTQLEREAKNLYEIEQFDQVNDERQKILYRIIFLCWFGLSIDDLDQSNYLNGFIQNRNLEVLEYVLALGFNADQKIAQKVSILQSAIHPKQSENRSEKSIKLLLSALSEPEEISGHTKKKNILLLAIQWLSNDNPSEKSNIINCLLKSGADNGFVSAGRTPLVYAIVRRCPVEVIDVLIRSGGDAKDLLVGKAYMTPLMVATSINSREIVQLLLDHDCSVTPQNENQQNALDIATNNLMALSIPDDDSVRIEITEIPGRFRAFYQNLLPSNRVSMRLRLPTRNRERYLFFQQLIFSIGRLLIWLGKSTEHREIISSLIQAGATSTDTDIDLSFGGVSFYLRDFEKIETIINNALSVELTEVQKSFLLHALQRLKLRVMYPDYYTSLHSLFNLVPLEKFSDYKRNIKYQLVKNEVDATSRLVNALLNQYEDENQFRRTVENIQTEINSDEDHLAYTRIFKNCFEYTLQLPNLKRLLSNFGTEPTIYYTTFMSNYSLYSTPAAAISDEDPSDLIQMTTSPSSSSFGLTPH